MKQKLATLFFMAFIPIAMVAYDCQVNGIYYNLDNTNNTAHVTSKNSDLNSYSGSIVIPSSFVYNGTTYTVTSIWDDAFSRCSGLTSITIPNSVTCIGSSAFSGCSGLTSITIPESVTNIEIGAFYFCSGLTSVTIPNSVTSIGKEAFGNCSNLTSVTISNSVTSIEELAFSGCSGLTSVTIPNSVTSIGRYAFRNCSGLTSVTIPNSVMSIMDGTFSGCSGLTSVTIPNSVTSIGRYAFSGCSGLTSVTIPNSVTSIGSRAFFNCSGLTSVTIGNSVTSIGVQTFRGCSSLTSVTIPNSVTSIESAAFYDCSGLTSITIPESVTSIGDGAFSDCSSLTSVTVENPTPITISSGDFTNCKNATLYVPAGSKAAYEAADYWKDFGNIIEIDLSPAITFADNAVKTICVANWDTNGDGELSMSEAAAVTELGELFKGNEEIIWFDELQYFTGLTSIEKNAFAGCTNLTSVTIPNSVTSIGSSAFEDCTGLTSVTIPESVTSIGGSAFRGCSGLTSVTIPNSVTSIGEQAFARCSSLTSMKVESGNTIYDSRNNCNAIIETSSNTLISGCINTTIPNSVTSIGRYAFLYCSGLTSITIPESVTSIGCLAFGDCSGLTSVTIPESVTNIEIGAFYFCSGLTSVTIPESVTSIERYAFEGCSGLTSMKVESGNTIYDSRNNCNAIIETSSNTLISGCINTTIPNSVTSIGTYAFSYCFGLTSVIIPESVTSIEDYAFEGCSGLTSVTVEWDHPLAVPENIFENVALSQATLNVPAGTKSIYETAEVWKDFKEIIEIDPSPAITFADNAVKTICVANWDTNHDGELSMAEAAAVTELGEVFKGNEEITSFDELQYFTGLTSIGPGAFDNCHSLTSVVIPDQVTSLESCAFIGCWSLPTLVIPDGVTSIHEMAVGWCIGMNSITIPSSVTYMESQAFTNNGNLTSVTVEWEEPLAVPENIFENINYNTVTLYVPEGTKAAYQAAAVWKNFGDIVEISHPDMPGEDTDYSQIDNTLYIERVEAFSGGQVQLSIRMKNTVDIQGYEFNLYLPDGVTVAINENGKAMVSLSTERTTTDDMDYFKYNLKPDGHLTVMCASTEGYTFEGSDGEVALITLDVSDDMEEGEYAIVLKDIVLTDANATAHETEYIKSTLEVFTYKLGDVNADTKINVADFVAVANHILGNTPSVFIYKAADVNKDTKINVADFVGIANMILNGVTSANQGRMMLAPKRADSVTPTNIDELDNAIYIDPAIAAQGSQQVLSVRMKNAGEVVGFEFQVQLPEGLTFENAVLSTERTTTDKTDFFNYKIRQDGTMKVMGSSTGDQDTGEMNAIAGNDGEIVRITINVPTGYESGEYAIHVLNGVLTDSESTSTELEEDIISLLTIEENDGRIHFAETDTSLPAYTAGEKGDITMARTINAGEWSTIVLPFNLTRANATKAFGADVQFATFSGFEVDYGDDEENVTPLAITVQFSSYTIPARGNLAGGTPVLIKTGKDISEIKLDDVTLVSTVTNVETADADYGFPGKFIGTFVKTTVPEDGLFLSGNKFWYSTGKTNIKAFRGWFELGAVLNKESDFGANLNFVIDGDPTSIDGVPANMMIRKGDVYTIQGQYVGRDVDMKKLPSGIYIVDGKKMVVK